MTGSSALRIEAGRDSLAGRIASLELGTLLLRRRIDPHRDTLGLRTFLEKRHYNAPFGVLVTMLDGVEMRDPRIVPVSLRSLLMTR